MSDGITRVQLEALSALVPLLDATTYLAGGVAIAVELRHRSSIDLHLFSAADFDAERLAERLQHEAPSLVVVGRASGTLHAELLGVPLTILSYRYPLLHPLRVTEALPGPVASLDDLACMKVSAIAGRGAAKDFWDLYALLESGVAHDDLNALLGLYQRKFASDDVGHVLRSLVYFGDADAAPLPLGLGSELWSAIKNDMARRVKAL